MSRASLTYLASACFEAARRLRMAPATHRLARWHGHSFSAQIEASLPAAWAAFPGAEIEQLKSAIDRAVRMLDYTELGTSVDEPTDAALAAWIAQEVKIPGWCSLKLRSAPEQQVTHYPDGTSRLARRYRFEAAHRLPNVPAEHP